MYKFGAIMGNRYPVADLIFVLCCSEGGQTSTFNVLKGTRKKELDPETGYHNLKINKKTREASSVCQLLMATFPCLTLKRGGGVSSACAFVTLARSELEKLERKRKDTAIFSNAYNHERSI